MRDIDEPKRILPRTEKREPKLLKDLRETDDAN
jgi:hypothetical protein